MFITIGGIAGAIKSKREERYVNASGVKNGMLFGLLADLVVAVFGGIVGTSAFCSIQEKKLVKSKIVVEQNVAESAGFSKFTGNAFTVSKDKANDKYYTEVFGIAIEKPGDAPKFSSVTYEVDQKFYDKAFKYVDIKYEYGTSGQLISATNEYRTPEISILDSDTMIAVNNLFKQLIDITQKEVINKRFYVSTELNKSVEKQAKGKFEVYGIGNVNMDKTKKKVSFTIDLVDVEKNADITAKRLVVVQDLTDEMIKDENKVYEAYINNVDNCKIKEIEIAKDNVLELTAKDGKQYTADLGDNFSL